MPATRTADGDWTMTPGTHAQTGAVCDEDAFFACGWSQEHSLGVLFLLGVFILLIDTQWRMR